MTVLAPSAIGGHFGFFDDPHEFAVCGVDPDAEGVGGVDIVPGRFFRLSGERALQGIERGGVLRVLVILWQMRPYDVESRTFCLFGREVVKQGR